MCHIVIGCVQVWWILHFILHNYISRWSRDALLMDAFLAVTSNIVVLVYDGHGQTTTMSEKRNMPHLTL